MQNTAAKMVFFILLSIEIACSAAFVVKPPGDTAIRGANTWSMLEISPRAFMSVIYHNFRISVYKKENVDPSNVAQFFYSPALILDPPSVNSSFNKFTKTFQVTFSVLMWDDSLEISICDAIGKKLNQTTVPRDSVRVLPIEAIRIDATGHSGDYEVINSWTSYANQPGIFRFRINCGKNETCQDVARDIVSGPEDFASGLVVYYSLQSQRSTKRKVTVTAEHLRAGRLSSILSSHFAGNDIIYLQAQDLIRLIQEITTSVLLSETSDEEFVNQDQGSTIASLIKTALEIATISTASLNTDMWNSVYWQNENDRPDKRTQQLNELFAKCDSTLKNLVKAEAVKHHSSSSNSMGITIPFLSAVIETSTESNAFVNAAEKERFFHLLDDVWRYSEWNGNSFSPKSIPLKKINWSRMNSSSVIGTTQVTITKTTSELRSPINVISTATILADRDKYEQLNQQFQQLNETLRTKVSQMEYQQEQKRQLLAETGTIKMTYSTVVPVGWLPCDGSVVDQRQYPVLYNLTGGVTPNLTDRFPVGQGNRYLLGDAGGEAMHVLTQSEMPLHRHNVDDNHSSGHQYGLYGKGTDNVWAHAVTYHTTTTRQSSASGYDQPHNNLPPYIAVQFIIKT